MIEHVIRRYLEDLKRERDFDIPFKLLLSSMGYDRVYFTHGTIELGKDFIAQKVEDGVRTQYSFQVKKGDLSLPDFRNDVQGQMLQSVTAGLSHPGFDRNLPHQAYLVVTGELSQPTNLAVVEQNTFIDCTLHLMPYRVWQKTDLIDHLVRFGLGSTYSSLQMEAERYGLFLLDYARALNLEITSRQIEELSRRWIFNHEVEAGELINWYMYGSLEAAILSQTCEMNGLIYEAVHVEASRVRSLCCAVYSGVDEEFRKEDFSMAVARLGRLLDDFVEELDVKWQDRSESLVRIIPEAGTFLYEIICSRTLELVSLCSLLPKYCKSAPLAASLLESLFAVDPGCSHPVSDYYLPALTLGILGLARTAPDQVVDDVFQRVVIWLCDRYERGIGLAGVDSSEEEELYMLFGYGLEDAEIMPTRSSLIATATLDLAAYLRKKELFPLMKNDFDAIDIACQYYLSRDSIGACLVNGQDVVHVPAVAFPDWLPEWTEMGAATSLDDYSSTFAFAEEFGSEASYILTFLLRDRYYKAYWKLVE